MKWLIVFSSLVLAVDAASEYRFSEHQQLLDIFNSPECKEDIYLRRITDKATIVYSKCKLYDGEHLTTCPKISIEQLGLIKNCQLEMKKEYQKDNWSILSLVVRDNVFSLHHSKNDDQWAGEPMLETDAINNLDLMQFYKLKKQ